MHNLTNHEHPRPLDVIGLGLATLDILVRFESLPTWEHGARFERIAFDGGGPVATALVAASRLGLRVGYVGTAGQDEFAERKLRSLQESGIDTSRVVRRPGDERQIVICCVRSTDGERVFCGHETLRTDPLRADELDRAYVCSAPLVHLDGFHPDAASQRRP